MKNLRIILLVLIILIIATGCGSAGKRIPGGSSLVNASHLDSLYEEISIDGKLMGIIHIYSNYPDYKWIGDDDEGIACVDDAARAAVFYLGNYESKKDSNSLLKSERLMEFLLFMQSDTGFFFNFILADHSINKTHKNSVAAADWWSWRAIWALSEGYKVLKNIKPELSLRISAALVKSVSAAERSFPAEEHTEEIGGIEVPEWLPAGSASDQAAVLLLAFTNIYEETADTALIAYSDKLCRGILIMKKGDSTKVPYGAFLSWQSVWHAYGSSQSYALLKAYKILKKSELKIAALSEINFFYDYLLKKNFLNSFEVIKDSSGLSFSKEDKFSQIAYGIRPMIFACLEAFSITKDTAYADKAAEIAGWFFGKNPAGTRMYSPSNGICFDGINSEKEVNYNSGAESTIEALLSLQMLERFGINKNDFIIK